MEVETREKDGGTQILVKTDRKVALVVESGQDERIYLPGVPGEDSTYYLEDAGMMVENEEGYSVLHRGEIDDISVLG